MSSPGKNISHSAGAIHVLTLTPFYPTDRDDVTGCVVSEPLNWLTKIGVHSTVFAMLPLYRGQLGAGDSAASVHWFRHFTLPGGFKLPTAGAFAFARIVGQGRELHRGQRIDLIHAHSSLPCGHAAMLLGRELNIPYVVSVHGVDTISTVQMATRAGEWCHRISQRVYASSRRVICISERLRAQVLEGMGRNCRTSVVYNGVDSELFCPGSQPPTDSPVILSVGDLSPNMGQELLVRAASSLASKFPALCWEFIGDGPERSRLQTLAEQLGLGERVRFRGRQSRQQVAAAMQRCTLFALAGRYQSLGNFYLEAMSSGKAVIGSRGMGMDEIIQHGSNGFLVGPDNEKELTLAIAILLREDSRRRNVGIAARDTILDKLTLAHQAESLARVYRASITDRTLGDRQR